MLAHNIKFVALIILSIFLSCSYSPERPACEGLPESNYESATSTIESACRYFSKVSGSSTNLSGVQIFIDSEVDCQGVAACARLRPEPILIQVRRTYGDDNWRQHLQHELYHVMLWRTELDLHPSKHHSRMRELRLCRPTSLCGYTDPPEQIGW